MSAKESLTSKGFVNRVSDVIGAELKDEKGNLNQMLKILADRTDQYKLYLFFCDPRRESTGHGISY